MGLLFRSWLCERKLVEELQFRKHYISRILNYYLFVAMMLNFTSDIFNLVVFIPFPLVWVSFVGWDIPFYMKFRKRTYWEKNHGWLLIERLTLHLPIIAVQIWMFSTDPINFFNKANFAEEFIAAFVLLTSPWFLWDHRWKNKAFLPSTRRDITLFTILSMIGVILYVVLK